MTNEELWRPTLHLAPRSGSISDPNGLNQFKGTYHFFCQNAPTYPPDVDSPHGWGHFASRDLVHWTFLGCHIMPDAPSDKDGSYSGGAYVAGDELWLYYTGNVRDGEGDGTYSGRLANQTLMKSYNGINMGPKEVVMTNADYPAYCSCHVRDPKVWEQDGCLHMMLGARTRADSRGAILCYRSDDGYAWQMEGSVTNLGERPFGYMWECPDRIVLDGREFLGTCPQGMAHAGDPDDPTKTSCQNVHASGYFPVPDGTTILGLMHEDEGLAGAAAPHPAIDEATFEDWDYGFDFYACQSFVDERGRTILIGWMSLPHDEFDARPYDNPTPTWRGCLTLPRQLSWSERYGKVLQWPVEEVQALRGEPWAFARAGKAFATILPERVGDVVIEGAGDGTLSFNDQLELRIKDGLAELVFTDDVAGRGRVARRARCGEVEDVRVVVDKSVLEIYLNGGATVFGTRFYSEDPALNLTWSGPASSAVVYPMSPISIDYLVER